MSFIKTPLQIRHIFNKTLSLFHKLSRERLVFLMMQRSVSAFSFPVSYFSKFQQFFFVLRASFFSPVSRVGLFLFLLRLSCNLSLLSSMSSLRSFSFENFDVFPHERKDMIVAELMIQKPLKVSGLLKNVKLTENVKKLRVEKLPKHVDSMK